MASRIKLLPNVLINKIAAGEVIERPASVVKELVENALDAKATSIKVLVVDGGMTRIEVNDNGIGMTEEDLKLAICRHATSKLEKPEDLFQINSFGFRGEAVPSITSVSQCTIKSRSRDAGAGYFLEIDGGEIKDEAEVGCDYGTYFSVKNLFFNTPARRKFLKSASSEIRRIVEVVESLAVSNPETEFVVESDEQRLLDLAVAADKFDRARQLFGASLKEKFLTAERFGDNLKIEIYLSKPEICRKNRSRIMILVNGRRIESKALFASVTSAYGEFLQRGMFPQGVVYITIDPSLVDVNVHPAKSEVRFADERVIFHVLYSLIRESLLAGNAVPGYSGGEEKSSFRSEFSHRTGAREAISGFFDNNLQAPRQASESLAAIFETGGIQTNPAAPTAESQVAFESAPRETLHPETSGVGSEKMKPLANMRLNGDLKFQQLALLYVVAISHDRMIIIDQHAAHERVLYELALKSFGKHAIASQQLLFPLAIHLQPDDLFTYNRDKESFAALGFQVSSFGPRQVQLEAVPAVLGGKNPETLFRELLDDFSDISGDEQKRYFKKAASFACRGAIMAGDRLTEGGMRALFENLLAAENPYVCPHGRPTIIQFSKSELDARFGRI